MKIRAILAVIATASACAAQAQSSAGPTPEAVALARTLVEKSGAGAEQAVAGLVLPIPEYLHQLGVTSPDRIRVLSREVVMPALGDHSAELSEIQVKSTATLLSVPEMKAAIAFYDSPAGMNFVKSRSRLTQANLPEGAALISQLRPEIQLRAGEVAHAHGWAPPPG